MHHYGMAFLWQYRGVMLATVKHLCHTKMSIINPSSRH